MISVYGFQIGFLQEQVETALKVLRQCVTVFGNIVGLVKGNKEACFSVGYQGMNARGALGVLGVVFGYFSVETISHCRHVSFVTSLRCIASFNLEDVIIDAIYLLL